MTAPKRTSLYCRAYERWRRRYLCAVLAAHHGNVRAAARAIGIHWETFYRHAMKSASPRKAGGNDEWRGMQ